MTAAHLRLPAGVGCHQKQSGELDFMSQCLLVVTKEYCVCLSDEAGKFRDI